MGWFLGILVRRRYRCQLCEKRFTIGAVMAVESEQLCQFVSTQVRGVFSFHHDLHRSDN